MVLQIRLQNYLATTKIEPALCRGFEDEAFQALTGLVHFSQGSDAQRGAWYRAVWAARFNQAGSLNAGPHSKSFFYAAVLNRLHTAFGTSFIVPKHNVIDVVESPWALDDPTFEKLNDELRNNAGNILKKEITWGSVTAASASWEKEHGFSTPLAIFSWTIITGLVKKYAPSAVAFLLGPEAAAVGGVVGLASIVFYDWTVRMSNADAKASFAIDETRRAFDRRHPLFVAGNGVLDG